MIRARIWLAGTEVTADVVQDDFPDWLETSVKGAGWFDWQVKAFEFRLHDRCSVTPEYGQAVRVQIDGTERFTGVVDGIKDAFSHTPLITAQPPAVTLKDVMAGTHGVDPISQEERYLYEIPGDAPLTIQQAVVDVLSYYAANRDQRLPDVDWVVDVQGDPLGPAPIRAPHDTTGPESGMALPDRFYTDHFWAPLGPYPVDPPIARNLWVRAVKHTATGTLAILSWSPVYYQGTSSPYQWYLSGTQHFYVAPLPVKGAPELVVPYDETYLEAPDFGMSLPAGYELAGAESAQIDQTRAVNYVREWLGIPDSVPLACVASIDHPDGTWAIVMRDVEIGEDEWFRRFYVTWWGDPLEQTVSGRWANTSMIDLIKLFAMVSGRWLKVEGAAVTLPMRDSGDGTVILPDLDLAIEQDQQKTSTTPSGQIQVERLDPNDPKSSGLRISAGAVSALQWWYIDRFAGVRIETEATWPISLLPAGLQLLNLESVHGQVINLDWSTDGRLFRVATVQEGQ